MMQSERQPTTVSPSPLANISGQQEMQCEGGIFIPPHIASLKH
jgi:hypothetical protein